VRDLERKLDKRQGREDREQKKRKEPAQSKAIENNHELRGGSG
jgi:hypothetical protein